MKTSLLALAVLCIALPSRASEPPSGDEDTKLHIELADDEAMEAQSKCVGGAPGSKCGGDAPAAGHEHHHGGGSKCGKITFSIDKEKKDAKLPKDKDLADLKYDKVKHSKLDDVDAKCYKKRLAKKKLLEKEDDYDKLSKPEQALAKKLAMLDKADEMIEAELKKEKLEAKTKNKLKAAKKELELEKDNTRSKCRGAKSALKC